LAELESTKIEKTHPDFAAAGIFSTSQCGSAGRSACLRVYELAMAADRLKPAIALAYPLAGLDELESGAADRMIIASRLRSLQAEVFELLVAERINADSALIAVLVLSNQLLDESAAGAA
jgi:hypothetical protein